MEILENITPPCYAFHKPSQRKGNEMSNVNISFTGTVDRVKDWGDNTDLTIKVDDGGNFPSRAVVKVPGSNFFEQGSEVTVTSARLPYGKTRTYTNNDGEEKTITDLIYPGASVSGGSGAKPDADPFGDDVPF